VSQGTFLRDHEGRLRTVWRLGVFVPALLLAQSAASLAALMFLSLVLPAGALRALRGLSVWSLATFVPFAVGAACATVWAFRRLLDRRNLSSLGLRKPEPRLSSSPLAGLVVGVAAAALSAGALLILGVVRWVGSGPSALAAVLMLVLALAAFWEELVFRGYLLQNMREAGHTAAGIVVSSALFTLMHGRNPEFWHSPVNIVGIFLCGVLFSVGYLLSGNLWFPWALHLGWNWCQGVLLGVSVSGISIEGLMRPVPAPSAPDFLTGGRFGLEGSVVSVAVVAGAVCFLSANLYVRRAAAARGQAVPGSLEARGDHL